MQLEVQIKLYLLLDKVVLLVTAEKEEKEEKEVILTVNTETTRSYT